MTQEHNPIKKNLTRVFSELRPEIEVPALLKEKVFETVEEENIFVKIVSSSDAVGSSDSAADLIDVSLL